MVFWKLISSSISQHNVLEELLYMLPVPSIEHYFISSRSLTPGASLVFSEHLHCIMRQHFTRLGKNTTKTKLDQILEVWWTDALRYNTKNRKMEKRPICLSTNFDQKCGRPFIELLCIKKIFYHIRFIPSIRNGSLFVHSKNLTLLSPLPARNKALVSWSNSGIRVL